jgi:hypothetical protein
MGRIVINGIALDPQKDAAELKVRSLLATDSSQSNYILLQTQAPLTEPEKSQLKSLGADLLEYVPENTYIAHYAPASLEALRALPFVQWANTYMKGFKIAPALHASAAGVQPRLLDVGANPAAPTKQLQLVDIVLHRDADATRAVNAVAHAAGFEPASLTPARGKIRLKVSAARLAAIAALDVVRHIEPVHDKKLFNNQALKILAADLVHSKSELQGEGEVVAVCDTGFDLGSTSNVHPAFQGRVVKIYALGRNTGSDPEGHGTHVCGSAVGDGASASLGKIRGTAPKAKLVMQSVLDGQGGLGGLPADLRDLLGPPYETDGARVHSNSWGDSQNAYTEEAREVDDFVWQHRDAVVVFAAGNDGEDGNGNGLVDAGSIGSPGTAKNCITVGASENDRPEFRYTGDGADIATYGEGWPNSYPVDPISSDPLADNPEGIAAFSSRGPTADGRIKPDVVAPGTAILSTRSRAPGVGQGWGLSDDPLYFFEGGTSMATPLVAGCAAVVRQYLKKQGKSPSAALVKAVLINSAHDQSGQFPSESGALPNINEGFGRVDLALGVATISEGRILQVWDEGNALDTGEEQRFSVLLPKASPLVKVTLVWTDPPGETLQNDLDLIVTTAAGTVRHGNMGTSSKFDRKNNVEQVLMHGVGAGALSITVRAFRAAVLPQSFALVCSATQ